MKLLRILLIVLISQQIAAQTENLEKFMETCALTRIDFEEESCTILKDLINNMNDANDSLFAHYMHLASAIYIDTLHAAGNEKKMWLLLICYGGTFSNHLIYKQNTAGKYELLHHFQSLLMAPVNSVSSSGYNDIAVQNRYTCMGHYHEYEYTLRYNGTHYDTLTINGLRKNLFDSLGLGCLRIDSIIDPQLDYGIEFRVISESNEYETFNPRDSSGLFFLLTRKNPLDEYNLAGVFPSFPEIHKQEGSEIYLDVCNEMPVFQSKAEGADIGPGEHYFDGQRYIGEIRFRSICDEKVTFKNKVIFSEKYGFEYIPDNY
ncbi:MAG: hypothetical protein KKA07_04410 [Bacteroidetes bacterium]|nr:hypothetical protein [Bacteroidota bacterium]MBU1718295.1 hypothetical protein [Bacteroidota bacterium]